MSHHIESHIIFWVIVISLIAVQVLKKHGEEIFCSMSTQYLLLSSEGSKSLEVGALIGNINKF